nr:hypothetical protein [Tanacetum cinerariifolium]
FGDYPVDSAHPFESPPAGEQCLNGKTSSNDKPGHLVLQMLWVIITRTNVDYAELLWEEFIQAIKTFFTDKANLSLPTKKPKPHVIPYFWFTKLIIYYLGSRHNIYRRLVSPVHVTRDDFLLGNLKFVPKGKKDEVFEKPIPQELIVEAIQNLEYYEKYLEIAAPEWLFVNLPWGSPKNSQLLKRQIPVTQDASTGPFSQPQDDTSTNVIRDTPSPADAETGADTVKSNSEGDTEKVTP